MEDLQVTLLELVDLPVAQVIQEQLPLTHQLEPVTLLLVLDTHQLEQATHLQDLAIQLDHLQVKCLMVHLQQANPMVATLNSLQRNQVMVNPQLLDIVNLQHQGTGSPQHQDMVNHQHNLVMGNLQPNMAMASLQLSKVMVKHLPSLDMDNSQHHNQAMANSHHSNKVMDNSHHSNKVMDNNLLLQNLHNLPGQLNQHNLQQLQLHLQNLLNLLLFLQLPKWLE